MAAARKPIPAHLLEALGARPPLTGRPGMPKADKDLEHLRNEAAALLQKLATRFAGEPSVAMIGELIDKLLMRPEHIMPGAQDMPPGAPGPNGSVVPHPTIPAALLAALAAHGTGAPAAPPMPPMQMPPMHPGPAPMPAAPPQGGMIGAPIP